MRIRIRLNDKVDADIISLLSGFQSRDLCEESRALLRMGYLVKYGNIGELINSPEVASKVNEVTDFENENTDVREAAVVDKVTAVPEAPKAKKNTNDNSALRNALLSANLNP